MPNGFGIDIGCTQKIINNIKSALDQHSIEIGIVIGGGNILRGGRASFQNKISRNTADQMGMLATLINGLALRDMLIANDLKAITLSARSVEGVLDPIDVIKAKQYLSDGYIVIFSGGTGNPYVTTDSAASLRAVEIQADALLKATTVDGVYNVDPNKDPNAKKYHKISYSEVLKKELGVMDIAAFAQCRDFNIPICVFNMNVEDSISLVLSRHSQGTWITKGI